MCQMLVLKLMLSAGVTRRLANASRLATQLANTLTGDMKETQTGRFGERGASVSSVPVVWSTAAGVSPLHHHRNTGGTGSKTTGHTAAVTTITPTIMHCGRRGCGGFFSCLKGSLLPPSDQLSPLPAKPHSKSMWTPCTYTAYIHILYAFSVI